MESYTAEYWPDLFNSEGGGEAKFSYVVLVLEAISSVSVVGCVALSSGDAPHRMIPLCVFVTRTFPWKMTRQRTSLTCDGELFLRRAAVLDGLGRCLHVVSER